MTDPIANTSAASAIVHLRLLNGDPLRSRTRASSGHRISTSADDAVYWSIATAMRADHRSLSAAEDALGPDAAVVDDAASDLSAAIDVMDKIKLRLVAAREPGIDRNKPDSAIKALTSISA